MNKILKYGAVAGTLAGTMAGYACLAASDTDLSNAFASSTAIATDNKSLIVGYIVSIFLVVLVIAVAKAGLNWGLRKIAGAFGGGRRKGR